MKKLISILFLFAIVLATVAQSTSPRFGTLKNQDNTGRVLTYKVATLTDASGVDSVVIKPNAWYTIYSIALTDTLTLKQPIVTGSYFGDNIRIYISQASGAKRLKFTGSYWAADSAITLNSTHLNATIDFQWNGTKWKEVGRHK